MQKSSNVSFSQLITCQKKSTYHVKVGAVDFKSANVDVLRCFFFGTSIHCWVGGGKHVKKVDPLLRRQEVKCCLVLYG